MTPDRTTIRPVPVRCGPDVHPPIARRRSGTPTGGTFNGETPWHKIQGALRYDGFAPQPWSLGEHAPSSSRAGCKGELYSYNMSEVTGVFGS